MNLIWNTCGNDGSWCGFHGVNLDHSHFNSMEGVYIIWQGKGPVVRLGQGIVKDRVGSHRNDKKVTAYDNLYVTWASVPAHFRDGIERFLADRLSPKVGDSFPNTDPIEVNLPWSY